MKIKKFFKNKTENFIILFSTGQIFPIRLTIVLNTLLRRVHKPKYDFNVN